MSDGGVVVGSVCFWDLVSILPGCGEGVPIHSAWCPFLSHLLDICLVFVKICCWNFVNFQLALMHLCSICSYQCDILMPPTAVARSSDSKR